MLECKNVPVKISTVSELSQLSLLVLCTHPAGELSRLGRSSLREAGELGTAVFQVGNIGANIGYKWQMQNKWITTGYNMGEPTWKATLVRRK